MKTCGNCQNFVRLKSFSGKRNGLCEMDDFGAHSDSTVKTTGCKKHKPNKYKRLQYPSNGIKLIA